MDTSEGAAFDAATLVDMQHAGLSDAVFYEATDTDKRPGGWGVIGPTGARKPSFFTFAFWDALQRVEVPVAGSDPGNGLWALASRSADRRRVSVLLVDYSASNPAGRTVELDFRRLARGVTQATISRIDATHSGAARGGTARLVDGRLSLSLAPQSVALVTLAARPPGGRGRR